MPRQVAISAEKKFNKGLITEATGLNFPENACTETYDCKFDRLGAVRRRLGIDYESNNSTVTVDRDGIVISKGYYWKNVIGDGTVDLVVYQTGATLHFWRVSTAQTGNNLSGQHLASTITVSSFLCSGGTFDDDKECQFTDGDGFLFVSHPDCDPFRVSYSGGNLTGTVITVQTRDFDGIVETGVEDTQRTNTLSADHRYNLSNQGWGKHWVTTSSSTETIGTGAKTFVVAASGLPMKAGDRLILVGGSSDPTAAQTNSMTGIVTGYTGTDLNFNSISSTGAGTFGSWVIVPYPPRIYDFFRAVTHYPSNSDRVWLFQNSSGVFAPSTTINDVPTLSGPAGKGFYILDAFNQQRDTVSGIGGLADVSITTRPSVLAWFQGRMWYSGVNSKGLNENVYFTQIVERSDQYGKCYSLNDPTSEDFPDLLPSDGGIVRIKGVGTIYKLMPINNGLLVMCEKGIWFITGSQGIGFTANDYTVTQISDIKVLSSQSIVNVQGYPLFWNEEGIYWVRPSEQGQLQVTSITDNTIASFYADIPFISKKYARGTFDPINNVVQWAYSSTESSSITTRFEFDRILNFNIQINCFYPWTISASATQKIHDVLYIPDFGNTDSPAAAIKYLTSRGDGVGSYNFTFAQERDTTYLDWETPGTGVNYSSYFVTGYKIRGDALRKFQTNWIRLYAENSDPNAFTVQSRWDYTITSTPGRWNTAQTVTMTNATDYGVRTKRLKLRGHGLVYQLRIASVTGEPFDIIGWVTEDSGNARP